MWVMSTVSSLDKNVQFLLRNLKHQIEFGETNFRNVIFRKLFSIKKMASGIWSISESSRIKNRLILQVSDRCKCPCTCFSECEWRVVSGVTLHANISVDEIRTQQVHRHAVHQRPWHLTQSQRAATVAQRQPDRQTDRQTGTHTHTHTHTQSVEINHNSWKSDRGLCLFYLSCRRSLHMKQTWLWFNLHSWLCFFITECWGEAAVAELDKPLSVHSADRDAPPPAVPALLFHLLIHTCRTA